MSYEWGRYTYLGEEVLRCIDCEFDCMGESREPRMLEHCTHSKHGTASLHESISSFIKKTRVSGGPRVALGYLCWNTKGPSTEGAVALAAEASRLDSIGISPRVIILDNGSTDGTMDSIQKALRILEATTHVERLRLPSNVGISVARNRIIDYAVHEYRSDYLMLMDGDIEIVPLSSYAMFRHLNNNPSVGCVGADSQNCTTWRRHVAHQLPAIREDRVRQDIACAWTQYGMFRCSMFQDGTRFDTSGPMGLPGWGYEDVDLYFQMVQAGWVNQYFKGMCYLHRNLRSSWPNLRAEGVDIQAVFEARRVYLIHKWRQRGLDPGILHPVASQQLPKE